MGNEKTSERYPMMGGPRKKPEYEIVVTIAKPTLGSTPIELPAME